MARRGESAREARQEINRARWYYRRRKWGRASLRIVLWIAVVTALMLVILKIIIPSTPVVTPWPTPTALPKAIPNPTKATRMIEETPSKRPSPTQRTPTIVTPTAGLKPPGTRVPLPSPTTLPPTGVPTQTLAPMSTPPPPPTPVPTPPPPTLRALRLHLLDLINLDRTATGLDPVRLGDNPAAQQHAEEMLEHSYLSHWGLDGLKPYMRYTLEGGVNYEAENASGVNRAPEPEMRYRNISPKTELKKQEERFMASPGHRTNILNPSHKVVNLGIACNRITCAVVQQFAGGYIAFIDPPTLSSGVFSATGALAVGFELSGVQIWYDRPPDQLSLGQLDTTSCYSHGRPVVFIREPAPRGSFYNEAASAFSWTACRSPYDAPPETPRLGRLSPGMAIPIPIRLLGQIPWVTADLWKVAASRFAIQADVGEILQEHGSGVYTVHIWGEKEDEEIVLSNYSIFYEGSS